MKPTKHPTNNAVLAAPLGVENCDELPITGVMFPEGDAACVSFWQPSPAVLALLNEGRSVRLCVAGSTHPMLALGVDGDEVML